MRRTYLDTGVLIEAARAKGPRSEATLRLLRDSDRVFLSSPYLDLELLPQVIKHRVREQKEFLETYLASTERIEDWAVIFRVAFREASRSPVSGMDALHVAAAYLLKTDEFITTEKPGRAIYQNSLVPVLYLRH